MPRDLSIFDSFRAASARGTLPSSLDTAGLRQLGADVLARAVFCARGSNAIFISDMKKILDRAAAGEISQGQARTAIWESLRAQGYTPEGHFAGTPSGEVPPAVEGSLQDLSSFRRRDLIVRTQLDLMRGAGQQARGHTPDRLLTHPAWELVRIQDKRAPRNWSGAEPNKREPQPRWIIAGGQWSSVIGQQGRMIALKGDPVWGELGSYDNFSDALGVDHPPFAFESGMGWEEISAAETAALGITGPAGESPEDWFASGPIVMAGKLPLPSPKISLAGVDPEIIRAFQDSTRGTADPKHDYVIDFSDLLAREAAIRDASVSSQQSTVIGKNP